MKIVYKILTILSFSLLIIWTGCKEDDEFEIAGTWYFDSVTPPEGITEAGDWAAFEIKFEGSLSYSIKDVAPGYEVLWTTDNTLFSSSEGGEFSDGTYVYTAATTTAKAFATLTESAGSFTVEVETDATDFAKMTLLVTPNVDISGRVSSIAEAWEFEMKKEPPNL